MALLTASGQNTGQFDNPETFELANVLENPLEEAAFRLQHRFQREAQPFSVEAAYQKPMGNMAL